MKILITGAGGAAAISVWKSLNQEHELYMADMDPCASGLYLVPEGQRFIIPEGTASNYLPKLLSICRDKQIDVLIPTVDFELLQLAKEKNAFALHGIKIPLSSIHTLERCLDKFKLLKQCQSTGLCPKFELLTKKTNLETRSYPCFAKPRFGAGSRGAMIVDTPQSLALLPLNGSYIVQELLPGEEYSVDTYVHSNGFVLAAVPRLRMKIDSGIAVACQTVHKPELVSNALTILKKTEIQYVANIQFKADAHGNFKLLEINPRFPGSLPLTMASGIDIPKIMINDLAGKPCTNELLPFKELMMVRYWTDHFLDVEEWKRLCAH